MLLHILYVKHSGLSVYDETTSGMVAIWFNVLTSTLVKYPLGNYTDHGSQSFSLIIRNTFNGDFL